MQPMELAQPPTTRTAGTVPQEGAPPGLPSPYQEYQGDVKHGFHLYKFIPDCSNAKYTSMNIYDTPFESYFTAEIGRGEIGMTPGDSEGRKEIK